ncbi:hypothetical protein AB1Y20_020231 [Prymnesium parvum]|uniref:Ion transport domain-containing protein n=1 Tax=Prymnesium parvum TaxID=97485 RepID=A0AB34JWM1_PRYPA
MAAAIISPRADELLQKLRETRQMDPEHVANHILALRPRTKSVDVESSEAPQLPRQSPSPLHMRAFMGHSSRRLHKLDPEVELLKKRVVELISRMDLQPPCCIIDPRTNRWLKGFDLVASLALVYVAIVTPVEVAFVPLSATPDALFFVNRLTDGIFIMDCVLQSEKHKGIWVHDPKEIARNYISTWFGLDLFSILISLVIDVMTLGDTTDIAAQMKGLRILRTLRLIKMLKLLNSLRVWKRLQMDHEINYGLISIIAAVAKVVLFSHWCACVWGLQATIREDLSITWLGKDFACTPGEEPLACFEGDYLLPYLRALYFAVATISSIGYGDVSANANNKIELLTCVIIMLIGSFLWATTLGTIIRELTSFDSDRAAFRTRIDALNSFMRRAYLPLELRRRLREYVHRSLYLFHEEGVQRLMQDFSPVLQAEVAWTVNQAWLERVSFLAGAPPQMLVSISLQLRPMLFAPGDLCPPGYLYLVQRGIVLYRGRLLSTGRSWGEDMVLSVAHLRKMYVARAMTYLEVHYITRLQLLDLAEEFPQVFKRIRWSAIWWALKRELILLGALARAEANSRSSSNEPSRPLKSGEASQLAPLASSLVSPRLKQISRGRKGASTFEAGLTKASDSMARDAMGAGALIACRSSSAKDMPVSQREASRRAGQRVAFASFTDQRPDEGVCKLKHEVHALQSKSEDDASNVMKRISALEDKWSNDTAAIMSCLSSLASRIGPEAQPIRSDSMSSVVPSPHPREYGASISPCDRNTNVRAASLTSQASAMTESLSA